VRVEVHFAAEFLKATIENGQFAVDISRLEDIYKETINSNGLLYLLFYLFMAYLTTLSVAETV
jgi:hypothetical protein